MNQPYICNLWESSEIASEIDAENRGEKLIRLTKIPGEQPYQI